MSGRGIFWEKEGGGRDVGQGAGKEGKGKGMVGREEVWCYKMHGNYEVPSLVSTVFCFLFFSSFLGSPLRWLAARNVMALVRYSHLQNIV